MLPCLPQGNIHIKRKLRVWRDNKCIRLVGVKPPRICAGRQTTLSQGSRYRDDNKNLRKVGWTYCHGTVFAPRQYLYVNKVTGMERQEIYSPHRCKNLTCAGCQTTPSQGVGIGLRTETYVKWSGPNAMVPCLHQENIYIKRKLRVWRDQKCTSLVGAKTSPVRAVKLHRHKGVGIGPRTETCVKWGGHTAMVPCLHLGNVHIKRKVRVWRDQKCIPLVGANIPCSCVGHQTIPTQGSRYRADIGNLRKLGWTYRHGTVFAPRQYLYQKEAKGMERQEMYSLSRCKNLTYLCGSSNYPVSRESV